MTLLDERRVGYRTCHKLRRPWY